jgi:hypothetical protein
VALLILHFSRNFKSFNFHGSSLSIIPLVHPQHEKGMKGSFPTCSNESSQVGERKWLDEDAIQMICYRIAVKRCTFEKLERPASLKSDSKRWNARLPVRAKQVGITFSGLKRTLRCSHRATKHRLSWTVSYFSIDHIFGFKNEGLNSWMRKL